MRNLVFAALAAALLCAPPARAQQQTVWYSGVGGSTTTGSLVTGPTDTVVADLTGSRWATAKWTVTAAGTATITTEVSLDGGVNWIASAYSRRLDASSVNPSVSPWSNNTPVAGSSWETPLPGNATNFRLRCGTSGTATNVTVGGGTPYTPGVPVIATLYDVVSGVATANATGVMDVSGWNALYASFSSGGATTVALVGAEVADDGFFMEQQTPATYATGNGNTLVAAATAGRINQTRGTAPVSANAFTAFKRFAWSLVAVTAQSTRLRVVASR